MRSRLSGRRAACSCAAHALLWRGGEGNGGGGGGVGGGGSLGALKSKRKSSPEACDSEAGDGDRESGGVGASKRSRGGGAVEEELGKARPQASTHAVQRDLGLRGQIQTEATTSHHRFVRTIGIGSSPDSHDSTTV